jgi:acetolactate decarboxylase
MHAGDRSPHVGLADVLRLPHCYAVGALDGLRGEVTIVDGEVWLSYPADQDSYRTLRTKETVERATLLVAAHVPTWQDRVLTEELGSDHLDETLADLASKSGVDTSKPFPFVLRGRFPQVSFHVIDGRRVGSTGDHAAHAAAGITRTERDRQGTLVGFYSVHHAGVFTHFGQRTHVHLVADAPEASGHVDDVVIGAGSVLKLPR